MDEWLGVINEPLTLNKFLYAHSDGINFTNPTGYFGISDLMTAVNTRGILSTANKSGIQTFGVSFAKTKGKKTVTKAITCQIGAAYIKKH